MLTRKPPFSSWLLRPAPRVTAVCVQDISRVYQIMTDEMLGSGQFGVVFAGNPGLSLHWFE